MKRLLLILILLTSNVFASDIVFNPYVPDSYLTTNVPLKDQANTFTQTNTFPQIKLTTGASAGKVLTSDASGNGSWQTGGGGSSIPITDYEEFTLLDNQSTPQVIYEYPATYKDAFILIGIEKNSSGVSTIMTRSTNGVVVGSGGFSYNGAYGPGHGVSLSCGISGGNIQLKYTTTNTGGNGKIRIKRLAMWE